MITVNIAVLKLIAEWLLAVTGAAAAVVAIVKKMLNPILKPLKEMTEEQAHMGECLARDKKRLDKHDEILELILKDNEKELITLMQIVNHLRTKNNTEAMLKIENEIDNYMATRK